MKSRIDSAPCLTDSPLVGSSARRIASIIKAAEARPRAYQTELASAGHTGLDEDRDEEVFRLGNLVIDFRSQDIWLKDRRLSLTPSEVRLLACLVRNAGRTVSRETLWQGIARGTKAMSRTLDMHIWRLREKMLAAAPDAPVIETIRGFGYRLRSAADKLTEASPLYGRGEYAVHAPHRST